MITSICRKLLETHAFKKLSFVNNKWLTDWLIESVNKLMALGFSWSHPRLSICCCIRCSDENFLTVQRVALKWQDYVNISAPFSSDRIRVDVWLESNLRWRRFVIQFRDLRWSIVNTLCCRKIHSVGEIRSRITE